MGKSPFATPVERFLVQKQHVRRLCIVFLSKMSNLHEKVTVCDACRALLVPNQHVRRPRIVFVFKIIMFHEKVTVCDACRSLLGHEATKSPKRPEPRRRRTEI